jgi:hypothetical protein
MKNELTLHVESADRSVGIMAEGFAGWTDDGSSWCELLFLHAKFENCKFGWFDNKTDEKTDPPTDHIFVEKMIWEFANNFYEQQERESKTWLQDRMIED